MTRTTLTALLAHFPPCLGMTAVEQYQLAQAHFMTTVTALMGEY